MVGQTWSVWLFRPLLNARRFRESAVALALPQLSDDLFLSSLISLVQVDRAWVPTDNRECSLYLRPFMFGSEIGLAVRPSPRVTYAVIASPSAPYFPGGINGMWLWVGKYPRAWQAVQEVPNSVATTRQISCRKVKLGRMAAILCCTSTMMAMSRNLAR